jgi:Domain of unknown function (DUF4190)
MSETSQGHGWWLASDGKWYPPEAWTGPPPQSGQAPYTGAGYPPGYQSVEQPAGYQGYPNYPASQSYPPGGYPPGGYPPQSHPPGGYAPQGTTWNAPPRTNGLATASLICACAGFIPFLFGLPSILGIIFGFVARNQIRNARGTQGGAGIALAGIIVGFSVVGLFILAVVLVAIFDPSRPAALGSGATGVLL